ncbi:uncharacterized protein Dvir_GJ26885, isoform B [Drosophila virilis]|uniref:Uncharacterized protein, isoform B n=1 Tax=Drosophila virilis TaxID=7244 RepID=A0A0Q9WNY7_DROVI|nr:uncharacterized protein Dvir_GJ26885, isoform B [Drosophila virilis]
MSWLEAMKNINAECDSEQTDPAENDYQVNIDFSNSHTQSEINVHQVQELVQNAVGQALAQQERIFQAQLIEM